MGVGRLELTYAVHEVIDIPMQSWEDIKRCRSAKVVNAIVKVMTDALQRGEDITIEGFGSFKIVRQKKHYSPYDPVTKKIYKGPRLCSNRPKVKFYPSATLKRMLREGMEDEPQTS